MLAAVAMVLAGVRLLGAALAALAGGTTGRLVRHAARPGAALLAGAAITAVLQSSSATTLLVLGAADAGWLDDMAAFAAVLGANVGTTVTAQVLVLPVHLLAPALYAAAAALLLLRPQGPGAGALACLGTALLFDGLHRLDLAVAPLADSVDLLTSLGSGHRPLLALAVGFALTSAIDSSSAAVALVQRLAERGLIPLADAFRYTYGAELGTTTGTLLASLALGVRARRAALGHVLFNALAVAAFWPLTEPLAVALGAAASSPARAVAHLQLLVNAIPLLCCWPLRRLLLATVRRLVPGPPSG